MVSSVSNAPRHLPATVTTSVKLVVGGRFGVGKTTFIGRVSEIRPLTTEADMTAYGQGVDDLKGSVEKTTTTVAMDFGRLTLDDDIVLYLFGAPGQPRFLHLVNDLMVGALAGVVLADTENLADAFDTITRFEAAGLPYVIAVNRFDGTPVFDEDELREAFAVGTATPVVMCDVRRPDSARRVLITLIRYLIARNDLEQNR